MRCQAAISMHQRSACQGLAHGSHSGLAGCGHDPPPQEPPPWGWCCARAVLPMRPVRDPQASGCRPCNHGTQARLAASSVVAHPNQRHTSQPTIRTTGAAAQLMQHCALLAALIGTQQARAPAWQRTACRMTLVCIPARLPWLHERT